MSLQDVRAVLLTASQEIALTHRPTSVAIQTLSLKKATKEHRSFIIGTWVKSYRNTARKLGIGAFYDKHEPAIAESRWEDCWVATDEDGYTVYAWVCSADRCLYHVYVIPELRRKRMASCLAEFSTGSTTPDLARPMPYDGNFGRVNPYLLHKKELQNA